nr:hypothetical protein [Sobelivirales sp.]WRQ64841.1 hypothetical protein [Sobelivirales sp.]
MIKQPINTTTQYQGQSGEDPTAPFWGHGNYVGPYWSDGKVQSSVVWGNREPTDALDDLARKHDAAYAHYKDRPHREAADALFAEEARKLTQKYGKGWAADPKVAATLVQYGNYAQRQAAKLGEYTKYGTSGIAGNLIGAGRFVIGNLLDAGKMVNGTYLKQERNDVLKFYGTDPKKVEQERRPEGTTPASWSIKKTPSVVPVSTTVETKPAFTKSKSQLIKDQAQRFRNYSALHSAAVASEGMPIVRRKRTKKNLNKALPDSYLRRKRNAVRPA